MRKINRYVIRLHFLLKAKQLLVGHDLVIFASNTENLVLYSVTDQI